MLLEPKYSYTDGNDAITLGKSYGLTPDPWQGDILKVWLGRDENDLFTATTCFLSVPRQNGKNAIIELRELYGAAINGEQILHTAHEVKTARKAFMRLASFFENEHLYPELFALKKIIRYANGQEGIYLKNGGAVEFSARSRGAARGFTADVMVMDEAQELTDEQLEALMYAVSASPNDNRQLIYTGTPPPPNSPGTVFKRIHDSVHANKAEEGTSYHEWSVPEIGDVTDRKRWYATNPAMGIRITEKFTATEQATSSEDGFARERLGWWSDAETAQALIGKNEWNSLKTESPPEGIVTFGIKISVDGSKYALCAAVRSPKPHIELVDIKSTDTGFTSLAVWLEGNKSMTAGIYIDGKNGADALKNSLIEIGYPRKAIYIANPSDVIASTTILIDSIRAKSITHFGQPALDESALGSIKRDIGREGVGFGNGITESIAIESAALALYGAKKIKRDPTRKMRVL